MGVQSTERADDVMAMFKDPSVKMIVANRGGWGCNRFIDMVRLPTIPEPLRVLINGGCSWTTL